MGEYSASEADHARQEALPQRVQMTTLPDAVIRCSVVARPSD
jgi:hypothetical protein